MKLVLGRPKRLQKRQCGLIFLFCSTAFRFYPQKIFELLSTKGKRLPLRVSLLVSQEGNLEPAFLNLFPIKETEK
jgi:hypothetical protein